MHGGAYSGAKYLAFNMIPLSVAYSNIDAGDALCQDFWEHDAKNYTIGKGNTPLEALINLKEQLKFTKK